MLKTVNYNFFSIPYPIVQDRIAYLETAELVSAVSNAGGLTIIAAANLYISNWDGGILCLRQIK